MHHSPKDPLTKVGGWVDAWLTVRHDGRSVHYPMLDGVENTVRTCRGNPKVIGGETQRNLHERLLRPVRAVHNQPC